MLNSFQHPLACLLTNPKQLSEEEVCQEILEQVQDDEVSLK